jgi:hypothetical protein
MHWWVLRVSLRRWTFFICSNIHKTEMKHLIREKWAGKNNAFINNLHYFLDALLQTKKEKYHLVKAYHH